MRDLLQGGHAGEIGKLRRAARRWAAGGPIEEGEPEAVNDARQFGLSDEDVAAVAAALGARDAASIVEVWPDNAPVVEAFLAAATQWKAVAAEGRVRFLGMDYAGALPGIHAAGIAMTPEIFAGLRTMEAAATDALNGAPGSLSGAGTAEGD